MANKYYYLSNLLELSENFVEDDILKIIKLFSLYISKTNPNFLYNQSFLDNYSKNFINQLEIINLKNNISKKCKLLFKNSKIDTYSIDNMFPISTESIYKAPLYKNKLDLFIRIGKKKYFFNINYNVDEEENITINNAIKAIKKVINPIYK